MGPRAAQLLEEYDAVLLAVGSTVARDMQTVTGRDLNGVHLAMDYLTFNTKARSSYGAAHGATKIMVAKEKNEENTTD